MIRHCRIRAEITNSIIPTATPQTIVACDGYSGCIGVAFSGTHPASRSVASLSSMSPLRIAVIGRQKLYVNFASQSLDEGVGDTHVEQRKKAGTLWRE